MAFFDKFGEQAVEEEHFAAFGDQSFVYGGVVGEVEGVVEVVGRVAALAQLHDGVEEFFVGDFAFGEGEGFGAFGLFLVFFLVFGTGSFWLIFELLEVLCVGELFVLLVLLCLSRAGVAGASGGWC